MDSMPSKLLLPFSILFAQGEGGGFDLTNVVQTGAFAVMCLYFLVIEPKKRTEERTYQDAQLDKDRAARREEAKEEREARWRELQFLIESLQGRDTHCPISRGQEKKNASEN